MLLSFPAHFSAQRIFVLLQLQIKNSKILQKKKKSVTHTHTNTHTCSRKLLMSLGKTIVPGEVVRSLTCWQRKLFPSGLNTEETLCCQSLMPAKLWRSPHSQYKYEHLLRYTSTMRFKSTGACSGTETKNPGTKAYFWGKKLREKKLIKPYKLMQHVQTMLHYATRTLKRKRYYV